MLFRKTRTLPFCYTAIRRSTAPRTASPGAQSIDCSLVAHSFGATRISARTCSANGSRDLSTKGWRQALWRSTPGAGFHRRGPRLPAGVAAPVPLDDCPGEAPSPSWPGRRARSPARSKPNQPDRSRREADIVGRRGCGSGISGVDDSDGQRCTFEGALKSLFVTPLHCSRYCVFDCNRETSLGENFRLPRLNPARVTERCCG
jgi:hypothetical protein